jgi:uncharacterized protein YciI
MFLILLNYTKPLEEIDRLIPAHRQFLERHYASGHLLLSGRKDPRTGGVILARAMERSELEAIIAQDPFSVAKAAEYTIIALVPTMAAKQLAFLIPEV